MAVLRLKWIVFFFLCSSLYGVAQSNCPLLLPKPQQVKWYAEITACSRVDILKAENQEYIHRYLSDLGVVAHEQASTKLEITMVDQIEEARVNQHEAYRLRVKDHCIHIEAMTQQGVYWAFQTLRQLLVQEKGQMGGQNCEIIDWPAFRIRGFMHDVGRGFIPVEELKKQIALLSQFKINVFHWHLTEDIAWRLESKVFPALTDSTNFERLPGKYYTIEEVKELVAFCQKHHVMLIPEIDMPGHSAAFTRALGHDMQSPEGMRLLKLLMDEVCDVFDDVPYLHLGTDEVKFTNPAFVPEMVNYIRAKGKKVISWNPGWHYQAGEIDMIQMWSSRGRLHPGIPAIDSRLHYINHFDTFADIVALYHSNVAGVSEGSDDVAGAIIAIWNDRYVDSVDQIVAQNGLYPAMLTLAESTWKGGRKQYFYEQGLHIGEEGSDDFNAFSDFEERLLHFKREAFKNEPFAYLRQTNVKWRITDPFPNQGDLTREFPPELELNGEYEYQGKTYKSKEAIGAGIYLRHVWGTLIPTFYADPQPNQTAYAYTWVHSPKKQKVGIQVRFQNYGRSEKDLPPPQGKWDYKESQIWLNNSVIEPPVWENKHTEKSSEVSLRNENWEGHRPLPITLEKGWNKLLLKLPVGEFSTDEVRLVKWMFNAVLVTPDGREALHDIIYSPEQSFSQTRNL